MLPPPAGEVGWSIAPADPTARLAPPPGLAGASAIFFSLLIPTLSLARSARLGGCHHCLAPCVLPPWVPRPSGGSCPRPSWRVWPHVSRLDYCLVAEPPVWSEALRRGGGFLPSRKCLGAPSPPTPLNGYTFTLFRRHPRRHGRSSIRL